VSISIHQWPNNNDAAFCLNFDDFSPFYLCGYDYGGDLHGKLIKQQEILLSEYDVKITHFVIPKSNFFFPLTNKTHKIVNYSTSRYALNNIKNSSWVKYVKELISADRLEIGMHGYQHFNKKFVKKHQEFLYDDHFNIKKKLLTSKHIFEEAGIPIFGFRQPGWGIDKDFNLFKVIKELGFFEYIAASSLNAGLNANKLRVNNYLPSWFEQNLNIPQNLELDINMDDMIREIEQLVKKNKIISLKGHFCNVKWIPNNFCDANYTKIKSIISYLLRYKIWYATFKEVSDYFKCISKVSIREELSDAKKLFIINLPNKIKGLTVIIGNKNSKHSLEILVSDSNRVNANYNSHSKVIFNVSSDNFIIEVN